MSQKFLVIGSEEDDYAASFYTGNSIEEVIDMLLEVIEEDEDMIEDSRDVFNTTNEIIGKDLMIHDTRYRIMPVENIYEVAK